MTLATQEEILSKEELQLMDRYWRAANYGLIGNPVKQSPGHIYHNSVFQRKKMNAVYVKMQIEQEELSSFFSLAKALDFKGLSVTIPLKEMVLPFLNEIETSSRKIQAINTLLFEEKSISGTNTDGVGALDAIEKKQPVFGKKIVLLGAGGASRGIAFEAKNRGAELFIVNRTFERAEELAKELFSIAIKEIPDSYDILINCAPSSVEIDFEKILPNALVMDIVYSPKETPLLKEALKKGCQVVYGEEMFLNQAARQTAFWIR